MEQKLGIDLIKDERDRQISVEGWHVQHDQQHTRGEIAAAAATYIQANVMLAQTVNRPSYGIPEIESYLAQYFWPWERSWLKVSSDPLRNLAKAGALIAAEADRLIFKADLEAVQNV